MAEILDKETLKALSTDTRQGIIKLLSKRPYTASELSKLMGKHVTTITEHLSTLEKSGLIKRNESNNKWVYYALSGKGERLFKPKFYSWIVVLAISILCLFVGGFQIFSYSSFGAAQTAERAEQLTAPAAGAEKTISELVGASSVQPVVPSYVVGIVLIIIAIAGFAYLLWRRKRNRNMVGAIDMIKL
jgi:DNA-binding transcriptional ArsR family regulator